MKPKFERKYFKIDDLDANQRLGKYSKAPVFAKREEANLIGSYCSTGGKNQGGEIHMPVLDIDWPCELIPSSTPGHFHLLIDKPMSWSTYQNLLNSLAASGVIEGGYARASIAHGGSYIRKPGVHKLTADPEYDNKVQEWVKKLG